VSEVSNGTPDLAIEAGTIGRLPAAITIRSAVISSAPVRRTGRPPGHRTRIPATLRHRCGLTTGDRVLLAADPTGLVWPSTRPQRSTRPTPWTNPPVRAAVTPGTRRVYGSYWNRITEHRGTHRRSTNSPNTSSPTWPGARQSPAASSASQRSRSPGWHLSTPVQAYTARPKAVPTGTPIDTGHYRVRHDRIDPSGVIPLRHNSRLHHIGLGRRHAGTRVLVLVRDRHIRVLNTDGQLLRELTLDPTRDYQPQAKP
jgi:hypothetical protein